MKTFLLCSFALFFISSSAQITTPVIRAGFGVDADLRANYFNGFAQSGNDDWFTYPNIGTGQYVIDTTGAAAVKAGYLSDVSPWPKRMTSFYRTMSRPQFSIVNNRMWLDALFIRDYHGNDTTVFTAGSDKNGMSPEFWSGGIQGIPDKNDILDMFMHVRRAGPNKTDSLWFFGALSLDNVTGNRYFDFEMYQTDIYYDRVSNNWYGYGPDEGHTSWVFDAAGNIVKPGDIIFSAEYQSASLTNIEARIWVHQSALSLTPLGFNWTGSFDGAGTGASYGYAGILPKAGGTFYTGLQSGMSEWAGPFQIVFQDNSVATNYTSKQFMEFSVNLTKLGLDPVSVFGSDICGTPFNRVVVKTRASASFTSELKDFVAPIDLFLAPRVDALADVPLFCGQMGASNLQVMNPAGASVYTWSTPNGNIVGSNTGTSITVDAPGTYIVMQQLAAGCNAYAYDTVNIVFDSTCVAMENAILNFQGTLKNKTAGLQWTTNANKETDYFDVERSFDGRNFTAIARVDATIGDQEIVSYTAGDDLSTANTAFVYYRLRIRAYSGAVVYSKIVRLAMASTEGEVLIFPNPARDGVQVALFSAKTQDLRIRVLDIAGALIEIKTVSLKQGSNYFTLDTRLWKDGAYVLQMNTGTQQVNKKLIINRQVAPR